MSAQTAVYSRARIVLGALALVALAAACDQPTQPGRSREPVEEAAAQPINIEVSMTLSAIVDDARTRVLPVFQDAATAVALDGALGELRSALDAQSRPAASLARMHLSIAIATAADGPDGSINQVDLDVVRHLVDVMDAVLPPTAL